MHDDGTRARVFHGRESVIDLVRSVHHYGGSNLNASGSACKLDLLLDLLPERIFSVEQQSDSGERCEKISEQFDTFAVQFSGHQ